LYGLSQWTWHESLSKVNMIKDMVAVMLEWGIIIGGREVLVLPEAAVAQWEIF